MRLTEHLPQRRQLALRRNAVLKKKRNGKPRLQLLLQLRKRLPPPQMEKKGPKKHLLKRLQHLL